jgi:TorA maturation chaperone TorD
MKRVLQPVGRAAAALPGRNKQDYRESLAAAALYRLVALGAAYPDRTLINAMGGAILGVLGAASDGAISPAFAPTLRALHRSWRAMPARLLAEEYSRLFLGAGLVPLREGGYGDGLRFAGQPFDIADLNGFYLAFGFELAQTAPSPPDHLGTEIEFVSLLHLKKAVALRNGQLRSTMIVDQAMAHFLEDHLGRWTAAFEAALQEANGAAPYALLATLLRKAIAADSTRLGVKPRPARRGTARDPLEGDRFVCPLAGPDPAKEHSGVTA